MQLVPLEVSFFVLLGVSVREMPSAAGLLLLTMLLQFFLSHSALPLPGPVSNAATLFVGTALGCAHEYVHGTSHLIVLLPTIVLLAPGATVLKAVLASIDASAPGTAPGGDGDGAHRACTDGAALACRRGRAAPDRRVVRAAHARGLVRRRRGDRTPPLGAGPLAPRCCASRGDGSRPLRQQGLMPGSARPDCGCWRAPVACQLERETVE